MKMKLFFAAVAVVFSMAVVSCGGNAKKEVTADVEAKTEQVETGSECCKADTTACCKEDKACCKKDSTACCTEGAAKECSEAKTAE